MEGSNERKEESNERKERIEDETTDDSDKMRSGDWEQDETRQG